MTHIAHLIGDISIDTVSKLKQLITNLPKDVDRFRLEISSTGGGVSPSVAAYNILKHSPVPVETHNLGEVSSAAILLFLAGSIRTAEPVSKFVFHPFSIGSGGDMSYSAVIEKLRILESDLKSYAAIVKAEAPAFCKQFDIIDVLKHQTIILNNIEDEIRLGILTPPGNTLPDEAKTT